MRRAVAVALTLVGVAGVACGSSGSANDTPSGGGTGGLGQNQYVDRLPDEATECFGRGLATDEDGRIPCAIIEVSQTACDCGRPGRSESSDQVRAAIVDRMTNDGTCGSSTGVDCADYCTCQIVQLAGSARDPSSDLYACQNEVTLADPSLAGFCYIDAVRYDDAGAPTPLGNPEIVSDCDLLSRRRVRFVGQDTPAPGALLWLSCG